MKFSGSDQSGENSDDLIGIWVDAYAHHVVIDSQYSFCIMDIQGEY